jgi:lysophospholipase L1-like esterase
MQTSRDVGGAGARTAVKGTARRRTAVRRAAAALVATGTLLGTCAVVGSGAAGAAGRSGTVARSGARTAGTPTTTVYYLALGDSLAAGVGSPDGKGYVNDIEKKEAKKESKKGSKKSGKKSANLVLENLGCSGATTESMIDGPGCSYATGTQLGDAEAFLEAHPGQVAFVTIDIGANDVDGCTEGTTINVTCVTDGLDAVETNLPVILSGLESAGGSTPIIGMSYYDPFLAAWLDGSAGQTLAKESVTLLDDLNGILAGDYGAAETADVADAFKSSDFGKGGMYDGKKVPVNVGLICKWTLMCSEENIHADDAGHAQIAQAFEKILGPIVAAGDRPRR